MKKIENDTEKGKDILYSWIGRINVVNMAMLPKAIYRFNAITLYQNTHGIFQRTRKKKSKIHMEPQKAPNCQSNLKKMKLEILLKSQTLNYILQSYSSQKSMVLAQTDRHLD